MKKFLSLAAVVALCLALCVPAFADEVPSFPEFSSELKSVISKYDPPRIAYYVSDRHEFAVVLFKDASALVYDPVEKQVIVKPEVGSTDVATWKYSGGTWSTKNYYNEDIWWGTAFSAWYIPIKSSVLYSELSTCTIYNEDGSVFFQPALPPLAEQLQTQAGELTQTQVAETLDFLVPLGIGFLALAISLILLRRVFRTFP